MLKGVDDRRSRVHRPRRDPARAGREDVALPDDGIVVDWRDWDRIHDEAGLIPPKDHTPVQEEMFLYDDEGEQVGFATSFLYSPVLQLHIGIGRVPVAAAAPGWRVNLEIPINHRYIHVAAQPRGCPTTTRSGRRPDDAKSNGTKARRPGSRGREPRRPDFDAIVVGGGHNGLTNGAYLAKAGLKTLVLERRPFVGGAAITEELRPGFWFTTFSYALSLLRPEIIQELDLVKHGFMPLLMPSTFAPMENGDYLLLGQDHGESTSRRSPATASTTRTPTTGSTTTSTRSSRRSSR